MQWPGAATERFAFKDLPVDCRYRLVQGTGEAVVVPARQIDVAASPLKVPHVSEARRVPLVTLLPTMPLSFKDANRTITTGGGKPVLVVLWASWCPTCQNELRALSKRFEEVEAAGIRVVAMCVDRLGDNETDTAFVRTLSDLHPSILFGHATPSLVDYFQGYHDALFMLRTPLPVPSSFLIDSHGKLAVIYKGQISVDELVADAEFSRLSRSERVERAAFLPGTVLEHPSLIPAIQRSEARVRFPLAVAWIEAGLPHEAARQLADLLQVYPDHADGNFAIGRLHHDAGRYREALAHYRRAIVSNETHVESHYNIGHVLAKQGNLDAARKKFEHVVRLRPSFVGAYINLGRLEEKVGNASSACLHYRRALELEWHADVARSLLHLIESQEDTEAAIKEAVELRKQLQQRLADEPR